MSLKGTRVVLTGGSGFLGRRVEAELQALIDRFDEAARTGRPVVEAWGTGKGTAGRMTPTAA